MQRIKENGAKNKGDLLVNSPSVYRHKTNKNTKTTKKQKQKIMEQNKLLQYQE